MSYYAADGTCGSCKYYEYKGKNSRGYCSWRRSYYYPDDSCRNWRRGSGGSGGGGCFLTTACCVYKGLADDCYELQMMRKYRDTYLKEKAYGNEIIQLYYEDAPGIIEAIEREPEKEKIYEGIYQKIQEVVKLIENQKYEEALIQYGIMVYKLKKI